MADFCQHKLVDMLVDACGVAGGAAQEIAQNVLERAEAVAVLDKPYVDVLIAPFLEEVFDHEPMDASWWLKAATTLVVRNSRLEDVHFGGLVGSKAVQVITTHGAGPLSHLLAAGRRGLLVADRGWENPFAGLDRAYPRAWACLSHLTLALETGGRIGYRAPAASLPGLPEAVERVEAQASRDDPDALVLSAIDLRFDQRAVAQMQAVAAGEVDVIVISALSRFSRNSVKLLRMLEFFLAHNARVLTTNLLLGGDAVWARRGRLVKPDSERIIDGVRVIKGLGGAHRKTAEDVLRQFSDQADLQDGRSRDV